MSEEILAQTAAAAVTVIAPFLPILVEIGKETGKKLADMIAEKGGEAAWNKAQALWKKIHTRFEHDSEITNAANLIAAKPQDEGRQTILVEIIIDRLKNDPAFVQELVSLMGGQKATQEVIADKYSWVEGITLRMKGNSDQKVEAKDHSIIRNVTLE